MRILTILFLLIATQELPAQQKKKPTPAKPAPSKAKPVVRPPVRYWQGQPSAQRYREIQQALAEKGYFQGIVDGNWGPESVEAMKKLQTEKGFLPVDGKITSLSLIALGLGSEHATIPPQPPPPPAP